MDDVDLASQHNAKHQAASLAAHRSRMSNVGPGSETCEECGDPIPEARRRLAKGCTRCTACQTEIDRRR